jgi:hypothetical protein
MAYMLGSCHFLKLKGSELPGSNDAEAEKQQQVGFRF